MILSERKRNRFSVYGRRGGKDQLANLGGLHRLNKPQRSHDVVVIVFERFGYRLGDGFQSREMNDSAALVVDQCRFQEIAITNVAAHHWRRDAGNSLNPLQHLWLAVAEIIKDDDRVSVANQLDA